MRVKLKRKRNADLNPDRDRFVTYAKYAVANARIRAKSRELPFDIDVHTIDRMLVDQGWRCAVSGIELTPPGRSDRREPFAPSIDRIVPELGYVGGNVRIVCNMANFAMNEWGLDALLKMARAIAEKDRP
jgi:hypothetical protein